ncbi:uncharacterized protein LOC123659231 [Melitaea cinxia]|uniref:uncharacterized protein LOC123659231 n=1 Tax=Melitaea cinxia TaxID=113334 RepID=UPI001E26F1EA|nr:uncharacterized protein LOC123659231 [Melitaea cinxia]
MAGCSIKDVYFNIFSDETAVLLNISDMIDLAIGTPEIGVVDFGMLHSVLHCLAQQLRVSGKNVELRGSVAVLPVGRDKAHTIAVSEFVVDTDATDSAKIIKKEELAPNESPTDKETLLVVERKKFADAKATSLRHVGNLSALAGGMGSQRSRLPPTTPGDLSKPREVGSSEKLSLVTISKFNILENTVEDLRNRVYGSIPKNEEILEEVRSQTNLKAITDMWTSLNVSSRLEATEAGLAKLSSLVQDVITETTGLQDELKSRPSMAVSALTRPSTVPAPSTVPSAFVPQSQTEAVDDETENKSDLATLQEQLNRLRADLDNLTNSLYTALGDQLTGLDRRQSEFPQQSPAMIAELMQRINDLEKRLKECCDSIGKNDGVVQDQLNSFQDQVEYLMKQVSSLTEELASGKLSPDLVKDLQGLMTLFQTVQEMQEQLKQVHDTALQLANEKEDRQYHMNILLEQIELLKTIKLDREDMVEAMADKADLRMLARKVSHDQFELACDDLSRGLEHALGKLNMQEALWQQALDDIQREIEMKLDKMELSPVKEFFNSKLRQLQENLKQMASLRREAEAAGTKRRLLRDVNCISCDANAVMPMEAPSTVPVSKPLPANLSMKPYLSYELDAIRKTQATNVPQRNLHDWENIEKQMTQQKQPQKIRSDTGKHICNRYCGGSHTVTTAAQRVARLGHFMKQWGPDVVPLSSGLAAGDDGRMYKVSTVEEAKVGPDGKTETCTPKYPKKIDQPKIPQKPITAQECHCLDGA